VLSLALAVAICGAWKSGQAQPTYQVLHKHVPTAVSSGQATLVSALPATQRLNFSLVLPLRNQADLTGLLARLYDPSSPDYRQFLSVEQFTEEFAPTQEDYQTVVAFAQANGFTVTDTPSNRLIVPLNGTVEQINSAFHVTMNVYQHPTEKRTFYSPNGEPSLNLGVTVSHIEGLNNFSLPRPMIKRMPDGHAIANVTGSGPGGWYLSSDMRAAYYGGGALTGAGQTVGLFQYGGYDLSDVAETFSTAGQTYSVPINNVLLDGQTGAPDGTDAEEVLDIVQAIGMAPGLSQVRVYIGNLDSDILNKMASENIAKQISCSWSWTPDDPSTDDGIFQELAAQGQSFFVASGDYGAYDAAISPFFYPADDDYVTAVGGTTLNTNGAGGSWASETTWIDSGGGISPDLIPIPSWQSGAINSSNAGSTTYRNVPDVAMEGNYDNYLCALDYPCEGGWAGTSFASPRWAGFMALVNQQAVTSGTAPKGGLGFINPVLYGSIGKGSSYTTDMHDITVGNNDSEGQPVWYSAVTGYDLVTGWGSANGQNLINALAGPQAPGFYLSTSPSVVSLNQGSSSTTTLTINAMGGFTGAVNLAVTSGLPSGVTASWGTNPTTGTSVLTLTATSSANTGAATLTITGTSSTLTETTTLALTVYAPAFTLSDSPKALTVDVGSSATSTITVNPEYGFAGNVTLAAFNLPGGVTASFGTNPATISSVLTLTASSSASLGTMTATIVGTSGGLFASIPLTVTVKPATTTSMTVTSSGAPVTTISLGTAVTLTATVNAGSTPVTAGQVKFCDAAATYCEDIHVLGTAQLTTSGTAIVKFIPGVGSHGYQAVFVGTNTKGPSSSAAQGLTVTGVPVSSTTAISQTGIAGNYTLSATVTGLGLLAPTGTVSFLDTSDANAVLGSASLSPESSSLAWLSPQSPATGIDPWGIATADFNGDGIPDLAVSNEASSTMTILLGNGNGTFTPAPASPATGADPGLVVTADFNGDGIPDLAVVNVESGTVTVLLGKGNGTFTPTAVSPAAGYWPIAIAAADFNGDGIPDLAIVNEDSDTVTILLGKGDGTFAPTAVSPATGFDPWAIVAADFNGDGVPDLAIANTESDTLTILLGKGDGTFTPTAVSPATGEEPIFIVAADFNGDGIPDLAISNEESATLTILLGNGDGTFTPTAISPATGYYPRGIAVADFNGDGIPDLAVTNEDSNTVTVLLGNGDGTFALAASPATGYEPISVAAGNFNGNGTATLAVANIDSNTVTILTSQITQKALATTYGISAAGDGVHKVDASYPGDSNFKPSVSGTTGITALPTTPTITWPTPAAITYGTALGAAQLNATSTVAGTYAYSPAAGIVLGAGPQTLTVTFTPTNTLDYNTATATVTLTVSQAVPAITWATPATIAYSTALSSTQLNATSTAAGSFTYFPAASTVPGAGSQTLTVMFTPTDATDYTTSTATVTLTVGKATPAINWTTPAPISYGATLGTGQLNASSPVPGAFVYSPAAATLLGAGSQTLSVTFTPTDTTDYTTATANVSLTVNPATPSLTWAAPAAITFGTALSGAQLNASSTVAGSFAYSPAAGAMPGAGAQTLTATFTPTDTTDYTTSTATVPLTVNKATPSIAWATPPAVTFGAALSGTQLNASSTVAGSFTYSPATGAIPGAGAQTLTATFTPTDTTDYSAFTSSVTLKVNQAMPVITWAAPSAITYGAALSSTQLNASSTVAGDFAYSPAAGTVLTDGPQTLTVIFTPTDATDYTTSTASVPLTVSKATPTITWAAPAAIPYGAPLNAGQLNASSTVSGTFTYSPAAGTMLGVGPQTLTATFAPADTTDYSTATATVTLTINKAAPESLLVASGNPVFVSNPITLTAAFSSQATTPTGSVSFYDGTTLLGSGTLTSGVAAYTTASLAAGLHSITAVYSGDSNYVTGISAVMAETIEDFSLTASGNTSATIAGGGQAIFTFSVTPLNCQSLASEVALAISGLPTGATVTFSPATIAASSGATSVTLTVTVPSESATEQPRGPFGPSTLPIALGMVLLPFFGRVRRASHRMKRMVFLIMILGLAGLSLTMGLTGCGSSSTPAPPQNYTVVINATSGALTHTANVHLTVQ
jgi:hypothetical protein